MLLAPGHSCPLHGQRMSADASAARAAIPAFHTEHPPVSLYKSSTAGLGTRKTKDPATGRAGRTRGSAL